LAIGFLAEVTRAYLSKSSFPGRSRDGQSLLPAATPSPMGGVTASSGRIGF
jgi:hypothetical protein